MQKQYYTAKEVAEILKISVQTAYRKAKSGDLPSEGKRPNIRFPKLAIDAIAEKDEKEEKLSFVPSTLADEWIKQQMNHPYDDEDSVPFKTIVAWRKKNSDITMNVKKGNQIVGWTTFLPLKDEIIMALLENKIKEKDIKEQDVRKWSENNISVYIPIIEVVQTDNKEENKRIGRFLVKNTMKWALMLTIQHDIKRWYAIGVTTEGQRLLEGLGFKPISSTNNDKRKGYILETKAPHVKLITSMLQETEDPPQLERNNRDNQSVI